MQNVHQWQPADDVCITPCRERSVQEVMIVPTATHCLSTGFIQAGKHLSKQQPLHPSAACTHDSLLLGTARCGTFKVLHLLRICSPVQLCVDSLTTGMLHGVDDCCPVTHDGIRGGWHLSNLCVACMYLHTGTVHSCVVTMMAVTASVRSASSHTTLRNCECLITATSTFQRS